ncbi:unnamed protein product, partial [Closterium sp. Naga37s-1]
IYFTIYFTCVCKAVTGCTARKVEDRIPGPPRGKHTAPPAAAAGPAAAAASTANAADVADAADDAAAPALEDEAAPTRPERVEMRKVIRMTTSGFHNHPSSLCLKRRRRSIDAATSGPMTAPFQQQASAYTASLTALLKPHRDTAPAPSQAPGNPANVSHSGPFAAVSPRVSSMQSRGKFKEILCASKPLTGLIPSYVIGGSASFGEPKETCSALVPAAFSQRSAGTARQGRGGGEGRGVREDEEHTTGTCCALAPAVFSQRSAGTARQGRGGGEGRGVREDEEHTTGTCSALAPAVFSQRTAGTTRQRTIGSMYEQIMALGNEPAEISRAELKPSFRSDGDLCFPAAVGLSYQPEELSYQASKRQRATPVKSEPDGPLESPSGSCCQDEPLWPAAATCASAPHFSAPAYASEHSQRTSHQSHDGLPWPAVSSASAPQPSGGPLGTAAASGGASSAQHLSGGPLGSAASKRGCVKFYPRLSATTCASQGVLLRSSPGLPQRFLNQFPNPTGPAEPAGPAASAVPAFPAAHTTPATSAAAEPPQDWQALASAKGGESSKSDVAMLLGELLTPAEWEVVLSRMVQRQGPSDEGEQQMLNGVDDSSSACMHTAQAEVLRAMNAYQDLAFASPTQIGASPLQEPLPFAPAAAAAAAAAAQIGASSAAPSMFAQFTPAVPNTTGATPLDPSAKIKTEVSTPPPLPSVLLARVGTGLANLSCADLSCAEPILRRPITPQRGLP